MSLHDREGKAIDVGAGLLGQFRGGVVYAVDRQGAHDLLADFTSELPLYTEVERILSLVKDSVRPEVAVPIAVKMKDFMTRASWIRRMFEQGNELRAKYGPEIHLVAGLSNISFGMPNRKLINQVYKKLQADGVIGEEPVVEPEPANVVSSAHRAQELLATLQSDRIGIVLQESYLFHGSVMENIRYAHPEASPEAVIASAKAANAHDFIVTLPQGYDTIVGERGMTLSGGQRQAVAISRSIF